MATTICHLCGGGGLCPICDGHGKLAPITATINLSELLVVLRDDHEETMYALARGEVPDYLQQRARAYMMAFGTRVSSGADEER